jgi:hypothetical protein
MENHSTKIKFFLDQKSMGVPQNAVRAIFAGTNGSLPSVLQSTLPYGLSPMRRAWV